MRVLVLLIGFIVLFTGCSTSQNREAQPIKSTNAQVVRPSKKSLEHLDKAYFASGCFWCVEAIFESVKGVEEVISGYAGGQEPNPSYKQVSAGITGHAEAVEVYYDATIVDYKTLVQVYYASHDPTTVDGQAPDFGRQYRSMILYTNDEEKLIALQYKQKLEESKKYGKPIVTEIEALNKFWKAEAYHQDFERRNPNNSYVRSVSIPRLNRFKQQHPELLKEKMSH